MGNPVCVFWDLESSAWSDSGCRVLVTNKSRTVCECNHLTNFALLMEEQSAPIVIQLPAFHVEIIVASVLAVFLLITVLMLFKVLDLQNCCMQSYEFSNLSSSSSVQLWL